ncbi:MAG: lipopolysaccharide biosynthesis protein [Bryobacterales bacterium]|nr:lipopolysaccharide biosynthesis protein [Bryobacterales bacterium]
MTPPRQEGSAYPSSPPASLAQKTAWAAAASAVDLLGRLAGQILFARMLGPDGFGRLAYWVWLVEMLNLVASFGLQSSLIRYHAELQANREHEQAVALGQWIYARVLGSICVSAVAVVFLLSQWQSPDISGIGIAAIVALLLLRRLSVLGTATVTGQQRFNQLAGVNAVSTVCLLAVAVPLVPLLGMVGGLVAYSAAALPMAWSGLIALGTRPRLVVEADLRRRVCRFALGSWLAAIISACVWSRAELLFLQCYWNASEVAMFTVGLTLAATVQQVVQLFSGAFMPHFSQLSSQGQRLLIERQYQTATKLTAYLVIPLSFGGAAIAKVLLPLVFGPRFAAAAPTATILILTTCLSFSVIGSALVYAMERPGFIAGSGLLGALAFMLASAVVVPQHGAWGAACVRLGVQTAMIAIGTWFITYRLGFAFPVRAIARIALAGAACGAAAWAVTTLSTSPAIVVILAVTAGATVYVTATTAMEVLDHDEIAQVRLAVARLPRSARNVWQLMESLSGRS